MTRCESWRHLGGMLVALLSMALTAPGGVQAAARAGTSPVFAPAFTPVEPGRIPRDVVASLVQDTSGFIWIGTGDGPVRFDGQEFRSLERPERDPAKRNLGWVQASVASRDGAVWLGSEGAGLVRHDPLTDTTAVLACGQRAGLVCPIIRALLEDRDGSIWVGTMGHGLQHVTGGGTHFDDVTSLPRAADGSGLEVRALLLDRSGAVWAGTSAGLFRRRQGQARFEPVMPSVLGERTVTALMQASNKKIWVGTEQGQLLVLDAASGLGQALQQGPSGSAAGRRGRVSALVEAPVGQVWVGRSRGLDRWSANSLQPLEQQGYDPFEAGGVGGHEVSCLMLSHDGWLWVGTFGVGLQKIDPGNQALRVRGPDRAPGNVLEEPDIRSLLVTHQQQVWVGTLAGDVAVLDAQWRLVRQLRHPGAAQQPQPDAPTPTITAMAQAPDGKVWMGSDGQLLQLSSSGQVLAHLPQPGGVANRMLFSRDGALWLATERGLYRLRPGHANANLMVTRGMNKKPVISGEMFTVLQTRDGKLWAGGHQGLFLYDPTSDQLQAVATEPLLPALNTILEDRDGSLWLDTAITGLHHLTGWRGEVALLDPVSTRHGIVNQPFGVNLLQDAQGRIWSHMHVYDPRTDRMTTLGPADGVRFGTGRFFVYGQRADGTMAFGGSRGLLVVDPGAFQPQDRTPPLVATALKVDGAQRPVAARPGRLQLSPEERSFSLAFAALDYLAPNDLRYRYRLNGLEQQWQSTNANLRQAAYSNLAPGHYRLEVQVAQSGRDWQPGLLAIDIDVAPTWWQTTGSRVLMVLLAMLMIGLLLHWRTASLRRRQTLLEHKVAERTQALQAMSLALEEASLSDPLTGLRNRRFLMQHMATEVALLQRRWADAKATGGPEGSLIFFMLDIDHFKQVNDDHGHAAGDAVLVQMRERLQRVFRAEDYLVRWGGEEFLIVARHTAHEAGAELAERACRAVSDQAFGLGDGGLLHRSCSVGFACFPLLPDAPMALDWTASVDLADAALFAAKHSGRNTWVGLRGAVGVDANSLQHMTALPLAERLQDPRWRLLRRGSTG